MISRRTSLGIAALGLVVAACGDAASTTVATAVSTTTIPATTLSATSPTSSTSSPATSATSTGDAENEIPPFDIEVTSGVVTGGGRFEVELGSVVRLVVEADVSDEVHVHGYDLFAAVTPEQPAIIELTVDIPGVFEVELEEAGLELAQLEVAP